MGFYHEYKWQNAVWQGRPSNLQHFAHALHNPSSSEKKFQFQKLLPCFDSLFAVKWFHWSSDNRFNIHQPDSNHVPAVIFTDVHKKWRFFYYYLPLRILFPLTFLWFCGNFILYLKEHRSSSFVISFLLSSMQLTTVFHYKSHTTSRKKNENFNSKRVSNTGIFLLWIFIKSKVKFQTFPPSINS